MSAGDLLDSNGVIRNAFLPGSGPTPVPTLAEVLTAGNNASTRDIVNVNNLQLNSGILNTTSALVLGGTANSGAGYVDPTVVLAPNCQLQLNSGSELRMYDTPINMFEGTAPAGILLDTNCEIIASYTAPDRLELVATGSAQVVVSDKVNYGRVYDERFNPPFTATITTLQSATGNITYNNTSVSVVAGGVYQVQLTANNIQAIVGPPFQIVVNGVAGLPGLTFAASVVDPSIYDTGTMQLMTNYFTPSSTTVGIEIPNVNWTGTWVLQLVRLG